jgi:hypothetical protein
MSINDNENGYTSANEKSDDELNLVNALVVSDKAKNIIAKLSSKCAVPIDRLDQSVKVVKLIRKLRNLCDIDDEIILLCFHENILMILLSTIDHSIKFESLIENMLVLISLICKQPTLRNDAVSQLVDNGGLVFYMSALRNYMSNGNIRVLAIDLIMRSIEYCQVATKLFSNSKTNILLEYTCPKSQSKKYLFHHLMMHGAVSSFSTLLHIFTQTSNEMSLRKVLKCK